MYDLVAYLSYSCSGFNVDNVTCYLPDHDEMHEHTNEGSDVTIANDTKDIREGIAPVMASFTRHVDISFLLINIGIADVLRLVVFIIGMDTHFCYYITTPTNIAFFSF